jgi:glycine hydroxymethyltransferase
MQAACRPWRRVVSGGTDNHLLLVDVTPLGVTGKEPRPPRRDRITVNRAPSRSTRCRQHRLGIRIGTPYDIAWLRA